MSGYIIVGLIIVGAVALIMGASAIGDEMYWREMSRERGYDAKHYVKTGERRA
jgi:hypothetical protein